LHLRHLQLGGGGYSEVRAMLEQITRELEADLNETREIPAALVQTWMKSPEPDIRGATYALLYSAHVNRVKPPIPFDDRFQFFLDYYSWCLRVDPPPFGWANTRYSAGWDLVGWFCLLWDEGISKKYFEKIKSRLEEIYKQGDAELKKAVEHAIMEHLFERKNIRQFFSSWKDDPGLKPAFDEAMLWIAGGGSSPLTGSPREKLKDS
jgi:hypothetical protein